MTIVPPDKILISGGKPGGGVASFAEALRAGFTQIGIDAEVAAPANILCRVGDLRNPRIVKILSTSAVFASVVARRTLCMAHGFPNPELQGWPTTLAILASLRLANCSRGAQLVAVSEYTASHLRSIFGLRVDAVIHNPVLPLFLETTPASICKRQAILFVGRLHKAKNVDRMLPAIRDVLDENPDMCAWILGDGPQRRGLERIAAGDRRIEFLGVQAPAQVRDRLRRSHVLVSGNPEEPFGIVYLEALSQGCAVAMPATGGGLEIAPELIGKQVLLFPASIPRGGVAAAIRKALLAPIRPVPLADYSPRSVAETYLSLGGRFDSRGICVGRSAGLSRRLETVQNGITPQ
jgi:glycosyltransferase involved in cell wall biosynthesis